jgi:hypothetical protein
MAGIAAASGRGPFGNVMSGISQAAQAAQAAKEKMQGVASGGGDLESRVAALEGAAGSASGGEVAGAAGSAGGGEVAGVAGMNDAALSAARGMFGNIGMRQSSITRGIFR